MMINKAYVHIRGDRSVGIPDVNLTLDELGLDCADPDDRKFYRDTLQNCFGHIYDGGCRVIFEDERPDDWPERDDE